MLLIRQPGQQISIVHLQQAPRSRCSQLETGPGWGELQSSAQHAEKSLVSRGPESSCSLQAAPEDQSPLDPEDRPQQMQSRVASGDPELSLLGGSQLWGVAVLQLGTALPLSSGTSQTSSFCHPHPPPLAPERKTAVEGLLSNTVNLLYVAKSAFSFLVYKRTLALLRKDEAS